MNKKRKNINDILEKAGFFIEETKPLETLNDLTPARISILYKLYEGYEIILHVVKRSEKAVKKYNPTKPYYCTIYLKEGKKK